jgi:hypothetical protein
MNPVAQPPRQQQRESGAGQGRLAPAVAGRRGGLRGRWMAWARRQAGRGVGLLFCAGGGRHGRWLARRRKDGAWRRSALLLGARLDWLSDERSLARTVDAGFRWPASSDRMQQLVDGFAYAHGQASRGSCFCLFIQQPTPFYACTGRSSAPFCTARDSLQRNEQNLRTVTSRLREGVCIAGPAPTPATSNQSRTSCIRRGRMTRVQPTNHPRTGYGRSGQTREIGPRAAP